MKFEMEYQLIRSRRRTLAVQVQADGSVVVRAPLRMPKHEIENFLDEKQDWINTHVRERKLRRAQEEAHPIPPLTREQLAQLTARAKSVFPERATHFAPLIGPHGVTYGRITIRHQHSRWGSCSAKGNLNFNCLLLLAPPEVLDYVVVHELCHRLHMDHSAAFWAEVARVMPEYQRQNRWLRENGNMLMQLIRGL